MLKSKSEEHSLSFQINENTNEIEELKQEDNKNLVEGWIYVDDVVQQLYMLYKKKVDTSIDKVFSAIASYVRILYRIFVHKIVQWHPS